MKHFKVTFEGTQGIFEATIMAKGRSEAEDKAEEMIKQRYFNHSDIVHHFFYTIEDLGTKQRRVLSVCNQITPPRK